MTDHTHSRYDLYDVAEEYHRHYDTENTIEGLRHDLESLRSRVNDLEDALSRVQQVVPEP